MSAWLGGFWFSKKRNSYIKIAFQFRTTPWRVYNLAHGSRIKSYQELQILEKLKQEKIISNIIPW